MKLIIELDEKQFIDIQRIASIQIRRRILTCEQIIANGIPLEEELKTIKEDMKDTFYDYKNNRYDVSMEGVLDVLDKRIKENKE